MKSIKSIFIVTLLFVSIFTMLSISAVNAVQETLVWSDWVYSSGDLVTGPILISGKTYRIVAKEIWWYDKPPANLAADAQYYTTDNSDHWNWGNHFPAPDGHSFLQIDGADVAWGPFSNGDTGHTYSIEYTGTGQEITFQIIDWIDDDYTNNNCHIPVEIYVCSSGLTPGFWKKHVTLWQEYEADDDFNTLFGVSITIDNGKKTDARKSSSFAQR